MVAGAAIQRLNYCTHAIEHLREDERQLRHAAPQTAQAYRGIVAMLERGVKFLLPNCGELLDPEELQQSHLDLLRLPFPVIALEAPWQKEDGPSSIGDVPQTPSSRRIALCWEPREDLELVPGLNRITERFPRGGAFVLPICWIDQTRRWMPAHGGGFLPYDNRMTAASADPLPASEIARDALQHAGLAPRRGAREFTAEPFIALPELAEASLDHLGGSLERLFANIILDTRDEVLTLVQACSVLNCANVATEDLPAPAALNRKRQARGAQPFFSYKVLKLAAERGGAKAAAGQGGSHASPRTHLRRGHLRRLEGKTVWVRPAVIGASAGRGLVAKDYALIGSARR